MRTFLAIFARFCRDMNVVRHRVAHEDDRALPAFFVFAKKKKYFFKKLLTKGKGRAIIPRKRKKNSRSHPVATERTRVDIDIENICGRVTSRAVCSFGRLCMLPGRYFFVGGTLLLAQRIC